MSSRESDSECSDSDVELQKAFKKGLLKGGLNYEVAPKREFIYNEVALLQCLKNIEKKLSWTERLDLLNDLAIVAPEIIQEEENLSPEVRNDFKREEIFYRQAQATVLEAIPKLHMFDLPTKRPDDYFAQMAKSDDHMKKVRQKLVRKQEALERSEKAKKLRELKMYGKQIQKEVLEGRQKEKKKAIESLKKRTKGHVKNLELLGFDKGKSTDKQNNNEQSKKKHPLMHNKKRMAKNKHYGFGGQKKRSKYNTKESFAEGFSMNGKGKKFKSNKRPGKITRRKMKNKKHFA